MVATVAVDIVDGLQVPVTPFKEVVDNAGAAAFWQSEPIGLKVGVSFGFTVIVSVVVLAHCPAVGVKV